MKTMTIKELYDLATTKGYENATIMWQEDDRRAPGGFFDEDCISFEPTIEVFEHEIDYPVALINVSALY